MKQFLIIFLLVICFIPVKSFSQGIVPEVKPNDYTIKMSRMLSKDIFELNGVPFLQPTVEVMNATSNARFYYTAYVPAKVDRPYFRVGLHGMWGVVPGNKKTYTPQVPQEEFSEKGLEIDIATGNFKYGKFYTSMTPNPPYIKIDSMTIDDPSGLMYYALKGMIYNGIKDGSIKIPKTAPTSLGSGKVSFEIPQETLLRLFKELEIYGIKLYDYLPPEVKDSLTDIFSSFPSLFNFPEGSKLNYFYAVVPQVEIGSLFGTELLLRFIPPVDMGKDIGKFAFWGLGIKHSISQYFNEGDEPGQRYFDMAVQAVYQGTTLKNSIGVTNSDLEASSTMWDFNLHASKHIEGIFDVYTGLSYEMINITSDYYYYLPLEMQWALGLIDKYQNPPPEYPPNTKPTKAGWNGRLYDHPGDNAPQKATVKLSDINIKWNIGLSRGIGPVTVFVDFNISKLMMLTGGIVYTY